MKRVVVFGSLPIASRIAEFVLSCGYELIAVIGTKSPHNNDPWRDVPLLEDYCLAKGIKIVDLDSLCEIYQENYFDIGLSCRFSRIIKDSVIRRFKNGIINMHGGLLPEFGGLYSVNHELLQGASEGGGTLHYIDAGIDTGLIIKRCSFKIEDDDTGYTVFQKTQLALEAGMKEIIPEAINHRIVGIDQQTLLSEGHIKQYYDKHSLDGLKEIPVDQLSESCTMLKVRAFDFPGYEPAYFVTSSGKKVYLRTTI